MAKVRIKLKSMNIEQLNTLCGEIADIASKAGTPISGPIPLPTKKLKISILFWAYLTIYETVTDYLAEILFFIAEEKKKGTRVVSLNVAETNPRAKKLYERLGFVVKHKKAGNLISQYGRGVGHEYMEIDL